MQNKKKGRKKLVFQQLVTIYLVIIYEILAYLLKYCAFKKYPIGKVIFLQSVHNAKDFESYSQKTVSPQVQERVK